MNGAFILRETKYSPCLGLSFAYRKLNCNNNNNNNVNNNNNNIIAILSSVVFNVFNFTCALPQMFFWLLYMRL